MTQVREVLGTSRGDNFSLMKGITRLKPLFPHLYFFLGMLLCNDVRLQNGEATWPLRGELQTIAVGGKVETLVLGSLVALWGHQGKPGTICHLISC